MGQAPWRPRCRKKTCWTTTRELTQIHEKGREVQFLGYLAILDLAGEPVKTYSTLDEQVSRILVEKSKAFIKSQQAREIVP